MAFFARYVYASMMGNAVGPGLDGPGEIVIGATSDSIVFGKERSLVIDNIADPPAVEIRGEAVRREQKNILFGEGGDGDFVVPEDFLHRLDRDMYYSNLILSPNSIIEPQGFRIFVSGNLTFSAGSFIRGSGGNGGNAVVGAGPGPAGVAQFSGTLAGGVDGVQGADNGGPGLPNEGAHLGVNNSMNSLGGNGGSTAFVNGVRGEGGIALAIPSSEGLSVLFNNAFLAVTGRDLGGNIIGGGAGGASGAGPAVWNAEANSGGGGGGAGGSVLVVAARAILGSGTIQSNGGSGGRGGNSGAPANIPVRGGDGGGGGGGGVVFVVTERIGSGIVVEAKGGAGGAGGNGTGGQPNGRPGERGNDGSVFVITI